MALILSFLVPPVPKIVNAVSTTCNGDQDPWLLAAFDDSVTEVQFSAMHSNSVYAALGGIYDIPTIANPDVFLVFIDMTDVSTLTYDSKLVKRVTISGS